MKIQHFLLLLILGLPSLIWAQRPPNIIIIFADDLGYGDVGVYGHPTIRTPHLDQMAAEGMKFTQFYVGASVCSPSRAALLTGRLPVRSGLCSDSRRVFFPFSKGGFPESELSIAEMLRQQGYATACIGKWHLGHLPAFLPTQHGFETFFGIPYSNDMSPAQNVWAKKRGDPPLPLMQGDSLLEAEPDQSLLTQRYTEQAKIFIEENQDKPFFLYLAHNFPHVPLYASSEFEGNSKRGLYGDVVEELDHGVGQILTQLKTLGLSEETLVIFTSDNGPWLSEGSEGGSAGLLRDGKGTTWEGGFREPMIAWWPGSIKAGSLSRSLATTMDLFVTAAAISGASLPDDRAYDGFNLLPVLKGRQDSVRDRVYYYRGTQLYAMRQGPWKAHFITETCYTADNKRQEHDPPLLFNLENDPGEQYDLASQYPELLVQLKREADHHRASVLKGEDQLEK